MLYPSPALSPTPNSKKLRIMGNPHHRCINNTPSVRIAHSPLIFWNSVLFFTPSGSFVHSASVFYGQTMCVENISSKDVYVFFILRRRVQRYCTAVRDGKNKKHIHRRHKFLCVLNKNIYLPDTVQRIIAERHIGRSLALIKIHLKRKTPHDIHEVFFCFNSIIWAVCRYKQVYRRPHRECDR